MGQTQVINGSTASTPRKSTLIGVLTDWAERGRVPDAWVRTGIRRLVNARRRQIASENGEDVVERFLRATRMAPVAVAADQANRQHYEVPAEFFQRVLGPRLKYSCCYWPAGVDSLAEAEELALRLTCEHAGLQDGMDVLELGCGWGSLSLWMAEQFPQSRITAVSNSRSQKDFIDRQAGERSLNNLSVITADMNQFQTSQRYDRVISVEMFEHMRNHGELMRRIAGWLRADGRLLVHIFCHRTTPYLYHVGDDENWMGRHFFSGGMMPSDDLLPRCTDALELVERWKWNGRHYGKTCRAWLQRLDAAKEPLQSVMESTYGSDDAQRWHNRWRMFFMACDELFAYQAGEQWYVSHYLFAKGAAL